MATGRNGATVTDAEKRRLEILASRRAISTHFMPLASNGFRVTLWQFADEVCPFLDKKSKRCSVYEWRPAVCRAFPLMPYGVGECESLKRDVRVNRVVWPPLQLAAGTKYLTEVIPLLKSALKVYDFNLCKWKDNVAV